MWKIDGCTFVCIKKPLKQSNFVFSNIVKARVFFSVYPLCMNKLEIGKNIYSFITLIGCFVEKRSLILIYSFSNKSVKYP